MWANNSHSLEPEWPICSSVTLARGHMQITLLLQTFFLITPFLNNVSIRFKHDASEQFTLNRPTCWPFDRQPLPVIAVYLPFMCDQLVSFHFNSIDWRDNIILHENRFVCLILVYEMTSRQNPPRTQFISSCKEVITACSRQATQLQNGIQQQDHRHIVSR